MINKCVKLLLILVFVVAVAIGVSMLPFSLSDKFKKVVETVTSSIKGLTGLDFGGSDKVVVDFSQTDNYTHGDFNVALDRVENVPKEGFFKFVHKGEKDAPLDVEKFMNGDVALEGLEGGMFDYCAGYFKGEHPYLLMVELDPHEEDEENAEGEGENKPKAPKAEATPTPKVKKNPKLFYVPGDTNWVKLPEGADLGAKVEEVFALLSAKAALAGTPGAPAPGEGGLRAPGVGPAPEGESGASGHGVPGPGPDADGRPGAAGPHPAVPVPKGPGLTGAEGDPSRTENGAPGSPGAKGVPEHVVPPGGLGGGAEGGPGLAGQAGERGRTGDRENLRGPGSGGALGGNGGVGDREVAGGLLERTPPKDPLPAKPEAGSSGGNSNDNQGGSAVQNNNQNLGNPEGNSEGRGLGAGTNDRGQTEERGAAGSDGNGSGALGAGAKGPGAHGTGVERTDTSVGP